MNKIKNLKAFFTVFSKKKKLMLDNYYVNINTEGFLMWL